MNFSKSVIDEMPTLKSPSVARMTRLLPSGLKLSVATLYASSIPAPPAVEPPAWSWSRAAMIFSLWAPAGGGEAGSGAGVKDDDRNGFFGERFVDERPEGPLGGRQRFGRHHRAADVEEED